MTAAHSSPPTGTKIRPRFRSAALLVAGLVLAAGCSNAPLGSTEQPQSTDWPLYGASLDRQFFNPAETAITRDTVGKLIPRWRFRAGAVVTAQPVVAHVDLPGEGSTRVLYVASWDGNIYALRAGDGSIVWTYRVKPHPGADYPFASSGAIAEIDGRKLLFVGGNMTMYCLDAASGALVWSFDAGDGCTNCDRVAERNEVESSPAVFDGVVYFGMDVNELSTAKGGMYAVDARRGTLNWYFDLETATTCHTLPDDAVRRFDGFHTAAELGLPDDFFATRPGCNFDRSAHGCGGVWTSMAIDAKRRLLYADSANCDAFDQGAPGTPGVMPPFGETVFAMTLDGEPAWRWRPRDTDDRDLDFGATPNLFEVEIGGARREVVGYGGKDGTYYVLDRDGVNQITGKIEPYWSTNVVSGGGQGGLIGSAAVGDDGVFFATAAGADIANPQRPTEHALDAAGGAIRWQIQDAPPNFGPTSLVPGVAFMGGITTKLYARDSATGALLATLDVGGSLSSGAAIVDGTLYIGSGTGARAEPEDVADISARTPSPINAFCVAGSDGCPEEGRCNDADDCTVDALGADGTSCTHSPAADGTACQIGTNTGQCRAGVCNFASLDCDDSNDCTSETATPTRCVRQSLPTGTPCTTRGRPGTCRNALCFPTQS